MDAELGHEAGDHTEKADAIIVPVLHQIVEAIDTERCPLALRFDDEVALTRRKFDFEARRRGLRHGSTFRLQEWRGFFAIARFEVTDQQTQHGHYRQHKAYIMDRRTSDTHLVEPFRMTSDSASNSDQRWHH